MFPAPFTADLARAHCGELLEQAARYRLGRAARNAQGSVRPHRWGRPARLLRRTASRRRLMEWSKPGGMARCRRAAVRVGDQAS
jgi:hypothetical protein